MVSLPIATYALRYPRCPDCRAAVGPAAAACSCCGHPLVVGGRYRLAQSLARTRVGVLLSAVDLDTQERLAIKRIYGGANDEAVVRAELAGLARILGKATCAPGYSGHFDHGDDTYILLDHVAGGPLGDRLDLPWEPARVMACLDALLATVDELHAHGLPCRDLTPQNLFLTCDDRLLLVDYGLFTPRAADLAFVAPELLEGSVGARSDLYTAGATALWLLTGAPPSLALVRRGSIELRGLPADTPAELLDTIQRLLERRPGARPHHARAALRRLRGEARLPRLATALAAAAVTLLLMVAVVTLTLLGPAIGSGIGLSLGAGI